MSEYNWPEIFERYRTGKYSMRELAEEYGFSVRYGQRKAQNMGVEKGESSELVRKEAAKKTLEDEANKEAKLRLRYEEIIERIRDDAFDIAILTNDFDKLKQYKILSEIIRNCRKEQWELNKIREVAHELDINQRTLETIDFEFDIIESSKDKK